MHTGLGRWVHHDQYSHLGGHHNKKDDRQDNATTTTTTTPATANHHDKDDHHHYGDDHHGPGGHCYGGCGSLDLNVENHHNLNISKSIVYITTLLQVPNYKTTLCQPWTSSGQCSYGDTCMYAHGRAQLRVQQGAVGTVQYQYQYRDSNKDSNIIHRGTQQHSTGAVQPDSKRFRM